MTICNDYHLTATCVGQKFTEPGLSFLNADLFHAVIVILWWIEGNIAVDVDENESLAAHTVESLHGVGQCVSERFLTTVAQQSAGPKPAGRAGILVLQEVIFSSLCRKRQRESFPASNRSGQAERGWGLPRQREAEQSARSDRGYAAQARFEAGLALQIRAPSHNAPIRQ